MAYTLKEITVRTDNTPEGMKAIGELWEDVVSGRLPILFDSARCFQPGISPVSRYSNYESDEKGSYDLSILGVTSEFFGRMEAEVLAGRYRKYDESGDDMDLCTKVAWDKVWREQAAGSIKRAFTADYESMVPAEYTKDGKVHCYLYIAVLDAD